MSLRRRWKREDTPSSHIFCRSYLLVQFLVVLAFQTTAEVPCAGLGLSLPSTTLAGSAGVSGPATTDGQGTNFLFSSPYGIAALDTASDLLFISDVGKNNLAVYNRSSGNAMNIVGGGADGLTSGSSDGTGSSAFFSSPSGLAVDSRVSGTAFVYVADMSNRRIRAAIVSRTTPSLATTQSRPVAGSGSSGCVDNVIGGLATFYLPVTLAIDWSVGAFGALFVGDAGSCTVRAVAMGSAGSDPFTLGYATTTMAGSGGSYPACSCGTAADGIGTAAQFGEVRALASDGNGNLFVADGMPNFAIRKIVVATAAVSTFAGTIGSSGSADGTAATFGIVYGLAVDAAVSPAVVYAADFSAGALRAMYVTDTPAVVTLAGGVGPGGSSTGADGIGTNALFAGVATLALVSSNGGTSATDALLLDNAALTLRAVPLTCTAPSSSPSSTASASATASSSASVSVTGTASSSTTASTTPSVSSSAPPAVSPRLCPPAFATYVMAGAASGYADGSGTAARFLQPFGLSSSTASQAVYVVDYGNRLIRMLNSSTGVVTTLAGNASASAVAADGVGIAASFASPTNAALDDDAGVLYVTDAQLVRVLSLATGAVTTVAGGGQSGLERNCVDGVGTEALFGTAFSAAYDGAGSLFVADGDCLTIRLLPVTGAGVMAGSSLTLAGQVISSGQGLWTGAPGHADGSGTNALFAALYGIAVHLATVNSVSTTTVYVSDKNYIRTVDASTGVVSTLAGVADATSAADGVGTYARFGYDLEGLVVDAEGAFLYATDRQFSLVRAVDLVDGVVQTIAGTASVSSTDGVGTAASFEQPYGIALLPALNSLLVGDFAANQLRALPLTCASGSPSPSSSPSPTPSATSFLPAYAAIVVAGGGVDGTAVGGADGVGTAATFNGPVGVAIVPGSSPTTLYVADVLNFRVRAVSVPAGAVTTVAGNSSGYADGSATAAAFGQLLGIAVDATGSAYLTDSGSCTIRTLSASGQVRTLAGSGAGAGFADGPASSALFSDVFGGLALLSTMVVVADTGNSAVRTVDIATGAVRTLAGNVTNTGFADGLATNAAFLGLFGIAADASSVYVGSACSVHAINSSTGLVSLLAGSPAEFASDGIADGIGTNAAFVSIGSLALNADMTTLFVVDVASAAGGLVVQTAPEDVMYIRAVSLATGAVSTLANFRSASFGLSGLCLDTDGSFYVTSSNNNVVLAFTNINAPPSVSGSPSVSITISPSMTQSVYNSETPSVSITISPSMTQSVLESGTPSVSITMSASMTQSVQATATAVGSASVTISLSASLSPSPSPSLTASESMFTSFSPSPSVSTSSDMSPSMSPSVTQSQSTTCSVTASATPSVSSYSPVYALSIIAGTIGGNGQGSVDGFSSPRGLAWITGTLYVADSGDDVIRSVALASGNISTLAGVAGQGTSTALVDGSSSAARFSSPQGVAVDATGSFLVVADTGNNAIRIISVGANVTTLAGGQGKTAAGYQDGSGSSALFSAPTAIALDALGNVYVVDAGTYVRAINLSSGDVSTVAGSSPQQPPLLPVDGIGTNAYLPSLTSISASAGGRIYAALSCSIRSVESATGDVAIFAGTTSSCSSRSDDGIGTAASFTATTGLALDASDANLFVLDSQSSAVTILRAIVVVSAAVSTVAGNSVASALPIGLVAVGTSTFYIADTGDSVIRSLVNANFQISSSASPSTSPSLSPSMTSSTVETSSQSPSPSILASITSSATATKSISQTESQSLSASFSAAATATESGTVSMTKTTSVSRALTLSASCSPSVTSLPSATTAASSSMSASPSTTWSSTQSPSLSPSVSSSVSWSLSPSVSPACVACGLLLAAASAPSLPAVSAIVGSSAVALLVSDSLPPATASFYLSQAPSGGEALTVTCTLGAALSASGATLSVTGGSSLPGAVVTGSSVSAPVSTTSSPVSPILTLAIAPPVNWPAAAPAVSTSSLMCTLESAAPVHYPSSQVATVAVLLLPTVFPAFADVIVELPAAGAIRSSWSSQATVLAAFALPPPPGTNSSAAVPSLSSLPAVAAVAALTSTARAPPSVGVFTLTLGGSTANVTLVSPLAFSTGLGGARYAGLRASGIGAVTVAVNGLAATPLLDSGDGRFLRVALPLFAAICGWADDAHSGTCPSAVITITLPTLTISDVAALAAGGAASAAVQSALLAGEVVLAPQVACPFFCPGAMTTPTQLLGSAASVAAAAEATAARRALQASAASPWYVAASAAGLVLPYMASRGIPAAGGPSVLGGSSSGLILSAACTAQGYTDPSTGACTNASSPLARFCAYGSGSGCTSRPAAPDGTPSALCPGGARAWPLPGWWSASQAVYSVAACAAPALERCLGFDAAIGAVRCGPAYVQGSASCGVCAPGYYPVAYSTFCAACASTDILAAYVYPIATLLGALVAAFLLALVFAWAVTHSAGGTCWSALNLASKFATAVAFALQISSTVLLSTPPGMPAAFTSVVSIYAALQLQAPAAQAACVSAPAFFSSYALYAVTVTIVLLLGALQAAAGCPRVPCARRQQVAPTTTTQLSAKPSPSPHSQPPSLLWASIRDNARAGLLSALIFIYSPVASDALSLLLFTSASSSVAAYAAMSSADGASLGLPRGGSEWAALQACVNGRVGCTLDAEALASSPQPITLTVLRQNAGYVAWEGPHRPAGALAAAMLVALIIALPLALFFATAVGLSHLLQPVLPSSNLTGAATAACTKSTNDESDVSQRISSQPIEAVGKDKHTLGDDARRTAAAALPNDALEGDLLYAARAWDSERARVYAMRGCAERSCAAACCVGTRAVPPSVAGDARIARIDQALAAELKLRPGDGTAGDALRYAIIAHGLVAAGLRDSAPPPDGAFVGPGASGSVRAPAAPPGIDGAVATSQSAPLPPSSSTASTQGLVRAGGMLAPVTADDVLDSASRLRGPAALALSPIILSLYRPSRWYFTVVNLITLFALQSISVGWQAPASDAEAAGRLAATLAVAAATGGAMAVSQPFPYEDWWVQAVFLASLSLVAASAVLNYLAFAFVLPSTPGATSPVYAPAVTGFAWLVLVAAIGLLVLLVAVYVASLVADRLALRADAVFKKMAAAAAAARLAREAAVARSLEFRLRRVVSSSNSSAQSLSSREQNRARRDARRSMRAQEAVDAAVSAAQAHEAAARAMNSTASSPRYFALPTRFSLSRSQTREAPFMPPQSSLRFSATAVQPAATDVGAKANAEAAAAAAIATDAAAVSRTLTTLAMRARSRRERRRAARHAARTAAFAAEGAGHSEAEVAGSADSSSDDSDSESSSGETVPAAPYTKSFRFFNQL